MRNELPLCLIHIFLSLYIPSAWPMLAKREKDVDKITQGPAGHIQDAGVYPKKWGAAEGFHAKSET